MRVFLAGIMQGSRLDSGIHSQNYRDAIREAILDRHPDAEVICPFELHPNSVDYDEATGRRTLLGLAHMAGQCDAVVAYVPEASMGTAIEMWQAHEAGKQIWTISPLSANWVIRFLSTRVFPDVGEFVRYVRANGLDDPQTNKR